MTTAAAEHHAHVEASGASPRSFGIVLAIVFALIALFPLLKGSSWHPWALVVACLLLAIALAAPVLLTRPTAWWIAFGGLLSRLVGPIALGIVFYGVFVPYGLLLRLRRADPMRRRFRTGDDSDWIARPTTRDDDNRFTHQF